MAWPLSPANSGKLFASLFVVCVACSLGCCAANRNVTKAAIPAAPPCSCECSAPPAASNCSCSCICPIHLSLNDSSSSLPAPRKESSIANLVTPFVVTFLAVVLFMSFMVLALIPYVEALRNRVDTLLENKLVATISAIVVLKWLMEIENAAGNAWVIFAVTFFLSAVSCLAVLVTRQEYAAIVTRVVLGKQVGQVGLLLGLKGFNNLSIYLSLIVCLVSLAAAVKSTRGELLTEEVTEEMTNVFASALPGTGTDEPQGEE